MKHLGTARALSVVLLGMTAASFGGCSSKSGNSGALPEDVKAIIFLQRVARTDNGNVFDYLSYVPGGRLVKLEPPSADGKPTVITSDPMFDGADIMSYDLSFDAKSVVFSARLQGESKYNIFSMNLDGTNIQALTDGGNDYVYPLYLPGGRILFTTNRNVEELEPTARQFQDEYERATTAQVGTMNLDGTNMILGPRNVSHRVSPTLLPDGHLVYTEWRHMGEVNDGHLRMMNSDMTGQREAFGGEEGGNGGTNSYLKARFVQAKAQLGADGKPDASLPTNYQLVAVGTSRDRTLQAGKLLLIDLNGSEAASKYTDLTPLVPGDRQKSDWGRYYDAEIVGDPDGRRFLVSWADGPVESEILDAAMTKPNFGIYVLDGKSGNKFPIYDDPAYWDVLPRPVKARTEPPVTSSPVSGTSTVIGAINVYDSSVLAASLPAGSVQKVRIIEGFSGEEGVGTFGTTEFDGQSLYGELPIQPDNSFAAKVPGNVPFHIQLIDKFAMSIANESIWISGRAGETRFCGGCHEDRTKTPAVAPGQTQAILRGPVDLDVPRPQRQSLDFSYGKVRGVPWNTAIQPILDAKCVSCHDGDVTKPGNPSFTIMDLTAGTEQTFVFDLRGDKLNIVVGERMTGDFTASYISIMGLGEILGENMVNITGDYERNKYVTPGSAKDSKLMQRLNPPQRFPAVDTATRFVAGKSHPADVGGTELTPDEYYLLILNIDMGGQYYFRENIAGAGGLPGGP